MPESKSAGPAYPARVARAVAGAALALLSACGGGGGDGSGSSTSGPPPPPSPPADIHVSGTAATGAAMAGATVRVKCVAGTGTATTNTNGTYTLDMAAASMPCVVSATSADGGTVLHSIAYPGYGTRQTVNINPVTDLIVAHVAGGAPAAFFDGFGASATARVASPYRHAAAVNVAFVLLRETGVDFSSWHDPVVAPLVAATATTVGNAYDLALDALGTRLRTTGTTLVQLAQQAVALSEAAPGVTGMQFFPAGPAAAPARLEVSFSQPMSPVFATTGSGSVSLAHNWETSTKFVVTFTRYTSGGTFVLRAPGGNAEGRGFRAATQRGLANDVTFQFP